MIDAQSCSLENDGTLRYKGHCTFKNWFTSYLSDQKQYVSVNGQTFCTWAMLFLMCINDLPNVSKHLRFHCFADDTNIYFEAKDLETLQKVINQELRNVNRRA